MSNTPHRIKDLQTADRGSRERVLGDALETVDITFVDSPDALVAIENLKLGGRTTALIDLLRQAQAIYEQAAAELATAALDAMDAELATDEREADADHRDRAWLTGDAMGL